MLRCGLIGPASRARTPARLLQCRHPMSDMSQKIGSMDKNIKISTYILYSNKNTHYSIKNLPDLAMRQVFLWRQHVGWVKPIAFGGRS